MGIFDRLRGKEPRNSDRGAALVRALRLAVEEPSREAREDFRAALATSTLLLAVAELPPGIGSAPAALNEDTSVAILTTRNAEGHEFLIGFTSLDDVQARRPGAPAIGMAAEEALRLATGEGYAGIVINPAGSWIELRRDQIESLLT